MVRPLSYRSISLKASASYWISPLSSPVLSHFLLKRGKNLLFTALDLSSTKMSMIMDTFVGKCMERLVSLIEDKSIMMLNVKKDLKRLQKLMLKIQNVLENAERRRLEDFAINSWVSELKDVLYDADDILDLCLTNYSMLLDEHSSSSSSSFINFSCFACIRSAQPRYEIGNMICSLNDRLEEIYEDRRQFNLDHQNPKEKVTMVNIQQTYSTPAELEVVGSEIEDATKDLIKLMIRGEGRKNVYAITGMGGIGKTTLAQKIFNHPKVQTKFEIKVWVCVSKNYNEIDLLKQVIRGAKGEYGDANTKAELVPLLRSAVIRKSVFLVLDDVWRSDVWIDLLRNPLNTAQIDALILITTRNEKVAKQMGSAYIHHVDQLPVETGWKMLTVMINGTDEDIYNLKEIGIQILEKCHGLPLAIKAMAGILKGKDPIKREWEKILNSTAWNITKLPEEISNALYLSYDDLSSPLKQCFLYSSFFPGDFIMVREGLIPHWIAEGFIKEEGNSLMEDTAEEYYNELIRRNLLQLDTLYFNHNVCKIHDLFRALAHFIFQSESFSGNAAEISSSTKLRRLTLKGGGNVILGAIIEPKFLRTLFIVKDFEALDFQRLVRFQHLRVLDLTNNKIEIIPESIRYLVHLRLLDLDGTLIGHLPESIGCLSNLQVLRLCRCKNLKYLPQIITNLQNLRQMALLDTPLSFIPKGIERLKQLNVLTGFVVGDDNVTNLAGGEKVTMHSTLKELSSLSKLRILKIFSLERAQSGTSVLQELSQLKELQLSCSQSDECNNTEKGVFLIEKVFEELVPPKSLEELNIKSYFGHRYPKWMMSPGSYLPYLSRLYLFDISPPQLPPLGQLPNLRKLFIDRANAINIIGPEFLGGGVTVARSERKIAFPMLQLLMMSNMENLNEWFFSYEEEDNNDGSLKLAIFPCLHDLRITECPKLRSIPSVLEKIGLKELFIRGANSLKEVKNLNCIAGFAYLEENPSLERISNLPLLKHLTVTECYALKYVESLNGLQRLKLDDDSMDCLPAWLLMFIEERLRGRVVQDDEDDFLLELWCNEGVLRRCQEGGEDWAFIQQIPRLNAYVIEGEGYLQFVKQTGFYDSKI